MRRYQQGQYTAYAAWGKSRAMQQMITPVRRALSDSDSPFWDEDRTRETARSIGALPGLTPEQRMDALRRFNAMREERNG